MQTAPARQIVEDLESLWAVYDHVFDGLDARGWRRKHGKDWTVADLPYHLYYFDREIVLATLRRGRSVDANVIDSVPRSLRELDAWNAREFAERPEGETAEQSVGRWRDVRAEIRALLSDLAAADFEQPVFVPLMGGGWMSVREALQANIGHHWNHYTQLRLYLGLEAPVESPSVRLTGLTFYMRILQQMVQPAAVARPFTLGMRFTGPGGGDFSLRVADGRTTLVEGTLDGADLVMAQAPETFVKTLAQMHNPMLAMLTGRVKVRGLRHMSTFSKLMAMPAPDQALPLNEQPIAA